MGLVLIDIGNTRTRFAMTGEVERCGDQDESSTTARAWVRHLASLRDSAHTPGGHYRSVATQDLGEDLLDSLATEWQADSAEWVVSSVQAAILARLSTWHQSRPRPGPFRILTRVDFPIDVLVENPARVGIDRLAAAFAAGQLKPATHSAVIIDVGTAMTIDAIDRGGAFLGGCILPGIELATRALAQGTSQLPLVPGVGITRPDSVIGSNTEQAIQCGVYWSVIGAVERIVRQMQAELSGASTVFLTGGGAAPLREQGAMAMEWQPDLVMVGMALAALRDD